MIKVEPILYTSKLLSNGEHPVMIRLTQNGKRKYFSLGVSCKTSQWNEKSNSPSSKHPLHKEIQILISHKVNEIRKEVYTQESVDNTVDLESIKNKFCKKGETLSLSTFIDALIEELKKNNKIETANIYRSTKNAWSRFFKQRNWSFDDISLPSIKEFESFCEGNQNMPNTIFLYMRTLKTIINTAKLRGVIGDGYDPFNAVSFSKYRKVKTRKRALSRLDFKKIESIEIEPCTRKFDSRNYFVFSYYAGGVNFVDLAQFKWSNIENDQLVYTRRKTNEIIQLPLLGGAQEILDYYKAWHDGNPDAYVFPILDERIHQSEVSINNRIHKVNNQMNKDPQEIASDLNIQVKVTSYVARHTFATVMKYQGVPVSMIGQALGHENEKTTQIYLDSFGSEMMKEAFKKL